MEENYFFTDYICYLPTFLCYKAFSIEKVHTEYRKLPWQFPRLPQVMFQFDLFDLY